MTMPTAPPGMTVEVTAYIGDMILFGHQEHDRRIKEEMDARDVAKIAEMDARDAATKIEMATLKAMTESLHSGAAEAFERVKSEAEAFTKKMEAVEVAALARVEDFRRKGNELDTKVGDGFALIDKALIDMRSQGASQVVTGDAALARFDTLVAQAKSTHDANLREIVDKITELERQGVGRAAGEASCCMSSA